MSTVTVKSPSPTYTGITAGVSFVDGKGTFDPSRQHAAARYFDRHGYTYAAPKSEPPLTAITPSEPAVIGAPDQGDPPAAPADAENRDAALGADPGDGVAIDSETAAAVEPTPAPVDEPADTAKPAAKGKTASK
jgi:hypothetical protein